MGHDVFISYSSKDAATAKAVCESLEAQDIKCWMAPRDIPGGDLYPGAIIEAISASRVFILVFTSNSNKSNDVVQEVENAFQNEIPIIPFRVENVQPSSDLKYFLSSPQWLNALTPPLEFHLENLVDTVAALLKVPRKTKRKDFPLVWLLRRKMAVGVALALMVGALLFFDPLKLFTREEVEPPPVNYEERFRGAVELLSSDNSQKQLEGLRSLDQIAASGGDYWYWQVMDQLTGYVREHAPWKGKDCADRSPKEIPPAVRSVLQVIGARPAVYPAHFTDQDKEQRKRDLRCTDLRGLRLVDEAHLEYVDLQSSNLEGAVLTGADLTNSILKDAVLKNADLGMTTLDGSDLSGADINNANLRAKQGLDANDLLLTPNWECAGLTDEVLKQIRDELDGEMPEKRCE